jgi:hypothetical protein
MKWNDENIEKLKAFRKSGLKYVEIAKELHITENSVKMKIRYLGKKGQLKLQERLFDDNFTFDYVDNETLMKALIIWLCEGTSYIQDGNRNRVEIVNSDPRIIYLFVSFLRKLKINEKKIKLRLKIPFNEERQAKRFWSRLLSVPYSSFLTSMRPKGLKGKKKPKYGTLTLRYNSKKLAWELNKMTESLINIEY